MARLPADVRFERQERDTGEPDDTVYVAGRGKCYHELPRCGLANAAATYQELTREEAQRKWLAPCKTCVLDESADKTPTGPTVADIQRLVVQGREDEIGALFADGGEER